MPKIKSFISSETSLIKKEKLITKAESQINPNRIKKLTGFGTSTTQYTLGSIALPLDFNDEDYLMNFHVIEESTANLQVDGIIGRNIMTEGEATIDCARNALTFYKFGIRLPLMCLHQVEPKTQAILNIDVSPDSPEEGILDLPHINAQTNAHISANHLVRKSKENTVPIFVTNSTDQTLGIFMPRLKLTAPTHILSLNLNPKTSKIKRIAKLKENIRFNHPVVIYV
jgi:hypothetical protein